MNTMFYETDIAIVGGGISGLLLAYRILNFNPNLKIIILEKESLLGGKLKSSGNPHKNWGYGLNCITSRLYEFWNQTLKCNPNTKDLYSFPSYVPQKLSVLIGGNNYQLQYSDILTKKFVKTMGGNVACKNFEKLNDILEQISNSNLEKQNLVFAALWTGIKKDPLAIPLNLISSMIGICNLWYTPVKDWIEKVRVYFYEKTYRQSWELAINYLEQLLKQYPNCKICKSCLVVNASYDNQKWHVITEKLEVKSKILVVAHAPWVALSWLKQKYWPKEILSIALKTQPTSCVVLTEELLNINTVCDLADNTIIPSEYCSAVLSSNREICFQIFLNYETSFQAPEVAKAVKALKRAKRKFNALYPNVISDNNNIALIPCAWATPHLQSERNLISKLHAENIVNDYLIFCGEAYGPSFIEDENIIFSIAVAQEKIKSIWS